MVAFVDVVTKRWTSQVENSSFQYSVRISHAQGDVPVAQKYGIRSTSDRIEVLSLAFPHFPHSHTRAIVP